MTHRSHYDDFPTVEEMRPRDGYRVVPNSVVLMFVRGWQGGTLHQIAAELGVTTQDIQTANMDRMGELMRLAQAKQRGKRYYGANATSGLTQENVGGPK